MAFRQARPIVALKSESTCSGHGGAVYGRGYEWRAEVKSSGRSGKPVARVARSFQTTEGRPGQVEQVGMSTPVSCKMRSADAGATAGFSGEAGASLSFQAIRIRDIVVSPGGRVTICWSVEPNATCD